MQTKYKIIVLLLSVSFLSFSQTGTLLSGQVSTSGNTLTGIGQALGIVSTTTGANGTRGIVGLIPVPNYTAGSGLSISGTNVITNTSPDQTVTLTGQNGTTVTGTYPNFNINSPFYIAGPNITITGTTISGASGGTASNTSIAGNSGITVTQSGQSFSVSATTPVVAQVFQETWNNLTSWTSAGSPGATVNSNSLSFSGTSGIANYIRCSGYGLWNYERGFFTDQITVGGINATSSGVAIGIQSQVSTFPTSFAVNIELSTSLTGVIRWYYNGSLVSTSASFISVSQGDILSRTLRLEKNRFVFCVKNLTTGRELTDVVQNDINYQNNFTSVRFNAGNFAYYYLGGTHRVGTFTATSNHKRGADLLVLGDSRMRGASTQNINIRTIDQLNQNYEGTYEVLAQGGNRAQDFNINEITLLGASKILLCIGYNNIANEVAATAFSNFQNLVTLLGTAGYSIANGNLVIGLIEASNSANVTTFNNSILSTYTNSAIIDFFFPSWSGSGTGMASRYNLDGIHFNSLFCQLKADMIAKYFNLKLKSSNNYGTNTVVKNRIGYTGIGSQDFDPLFPLHILGDATTQGSQLVVSGNTTNPERGASLLSTQDGQAYISGGGYWNGSSFVATSTSFTGLNMNRGNFFFLTNANQTVGNTSSPSVVASMDPSGRFNLGTSQNNVFRTTNGGSDVTANLLIENGSTVASGTAAAFISGAFQCLASNGTRRILVAQMSYVAPSTTAGSETGNLIFNTKPSTGAVAEAMRINENQQVGIGTSSISSTLVINGSFAPVSRSITALRTLDATDHVIFANGTFTVTLPTAVGITDREYVIKNTGSGTITIATTSSQTIDGTTPPSLTQNKFIRVKSDGANWQIIGQN